MHLFTGVYYFSSVFRWFLGSDVYIFSRCFSTLLKIAAFIDANEKT